MTLDNQQLSDLYEVLLGGCITLEEGLTEIGIEDPNTVLKDADNMSEIETMIFQCEHCGFWVSPNEVEDHNGEIVCVDCVEWINGNEEDDDYEFDGEDEEIS